MLRAKTIRKRLHFRQPAGTSRGVYTVRDVWYVLVEDTENGRLGIGECAPLPGLSCDDVPGYGEALEGACRRLEATGEIDREGLAPYPSILFGMETATLHLGAGSLALFPSAFSRGQEGIPTNGLVWMGDFAQMASRLDDKLGLGFTCIKVKIGAIDFERELDLLAMARRGRPAGVELRVDANGAFTAGEAPERLRRLAAFGLHSIEQPIRAGQWEAMAELCRTSPVPIALDEELIGVNDDGSKALLLDTIRPSYIVLKPSLHGGIHGTTRWAELAMERGIGHWYTSALESSVGLNAIAQLCGSRGVTSHQGLGTGTLFTDNLPGPLSMRGERLWFDPDAPEPDWKGVLGA